MFRRATLVTGLLVLALLTLSTAAEADPVGDPVPAYAFDPPALPPTGCDYANTAYSGTETVGSSLVAWVEPRAEAARGTMLRAALVGPDGEPASAPIDVSIEQPFGRSYEECLTPEVTAGPDGEFLVAWGGFDTTEGPTYSDEWVAGQIIGPDGARIGSNFRVSTDTYVDLYGLQAAWSEASNRYLVSNNARFLNSDFKAYGTFIDNRGAPIGSDFTLISFPGDGVHWTDVAFGTDNWLVVGSHCYEDEWDCDSIEGVTVSGDGTVSSEFDILPQITGSFLWGNSVAFNDSSSEFLAVWTACSSSSPYPCYRYGRKLSATGTPLGTTLTIENTSDGNPAALSAGGADGYLVAWSPYSWPGASYPVAQQLDTAAAAVGSFAAIAPAQGNRDPGGRSTYVENSGCYLLAWVGNGNPANPYSPPDAGANVWTRMWDPGGNGPCTGELTVTTSGSGSGTVSSTPDGIDCGSQCIHSYPRRVTVLLTANPDPGSQLAGWGGACSSVGTSSTCEVTMSEARSVEVTFESSPPPTTRELKVTKSGSGSGTVGSTPEGIDCGSQCTHSYPEGTTVLLTATPDSGSQLASWGGACSSGGTSATCEVSMSEARSVEASFDSVTPAKPNLRVNVGGATKKSAGRSFKIGIRVTNKGQGRATPADSSPRTANAGSLETCLKIPQDVVLVRAQTGARRSKHSICWTRSLVDSGKWVSFKARLHSLKSSEGTETFTATARASGDQPTARASGSRQVKFTRPKADPRPEPPTG